MKDTNNQNINTKEDINSEDNSEEISNEDIWSQDATNQEESSIIDTLEIPAAAVFAYRETHKGSGTDGFSDYVQALPEAKARSRTLLLQFAEAKQQESQPAQADKADKTDDTSSVQPPKPAKPRLLCSSFKSGALLLDWCSFEDDPNLLYLCLLKAYREGVLVCIPPRDWPEPVELEEGEAFRELSEAEKPQAISTMLL